MFLSRYSRVKNFILSKYSYKYFNNFKKECLLGGICDNFRERIVSDIDQEIEKAATVSKYDMVDYIKQTRREYSLDFFPNQIVGSYIFGWTDYYDDSSPDRIQKSEPIELQKNLKQLKAEVLDIIEKSESDLNKQKHKTSSIDYLIGAEPAKDEIKSTLNAKLLMDSIR